MAEDDGERDDKNKVVKFQPSEVTKMQKEFADKSNSLRNVTPLIPEKQSSDFIMGFNAGMSTMLSFAKYRLRQERESSGGLTINSVLELLDKIFIDEKKGP